jgi:hypothetical protein
METSGTPFSLRKTEATGMVDEAASAIARSRSLSAPVSSSSFFFLFLFFFFFFFFFFCVALPYPQFSFLKEIKYTSPNLEFWKAES